MQSAAWGRTSADQGSGEQVAVLLDPGEEPRDALVGGNRRLPPERGRPPHVGDVHLLVAWPPRPVVDREAATEQLFEQRPELGPHRERVGRTAAQVVDLAGGGVEAGVS